MNHHKSPTFPHYKRIRKNVWVLLCILHKCTLEKWNHSHSQEVFIDGTKVPLAFSCRQEVVHTHYTKIKIDFVIRTQQQRNSKLEWKKKNLQHGICITLDALWIFPSSFRSVKVNGSHYACSLHTLASRCMCTRTHTHTKQRHKKYSHYF